MNPFAYVRSGVLLSALMCASSAGAANDPTECTVNADGVAPQIKAILGPHFAAAEDLGALKRDFRALEILLLQAGHCAASARSHGSQVEDRERNAMEWHSMNQWLDRMVGIVRRNIRGDASASWRDEYSLFAEVYEFEP